MVVHDPLKTLPELVAISKTTNTVTFLGIGSYSVERSKKNMILSCHKVTSNEADNINTVKEDIQIMIKARVEEIRHQRTVIDALVVQACSDPESTIVQEKLAIRLGIVHNHLAALKHPDLLVRCIESIQCVEQTTITLRPGRTTAIGKRNLTVVWTPCQTIPDNSDVITTWTHTTSSSLVPIVIAPHIRTTLNQTLHSFEPIDDDICE